MIAAVSYFMTSTLYLFVTWLRKPLIRENNVLEVITAILFLGACILGAKKLLSSSTAKTLNIYWCIPVLGLIGFLEETSFGHSFLYYDVPVIYGVKVDAIS